MILSSNNCTRDGAKDFRFYLAFEEKMDSSHDEKYTKEETLELRRKHICDSLSLFFPDDPIKVVAADNLYITSNNGDRYLDCINNVAHIGHCHNRVTDAVAKQMSLIYTNTRYLHDNLAEYCEKLSKLLPSRLCKFYFVNSGSEANDLALRLARAYTGNKDVITLESGYHGHLTNLVEISPYKFAKIKGHRKKKWVHVASLPCQYRGKHSSPHLTSEQIGMLYADDVKRLIDENEGRKIGAFIAESMMGCGGQIILPDKYLENIFRYVREVGGVCIADEVQVGFGRCGSHFWAFEMQNVIPDIVTVGKPMGNGHPIACVITTEEISTAFAGLGAEYFNTFGGNPASMAAAIAVLDVLKEEKLIENAREVGDFLLGKLRELMQKYETIGDVRGRGLFIGVEFVEDRVSRKPHTSMADLVVRKFRDLKMIMSTDGEFGNVIKLKPPMTWTTEVATEWLNCLSEILDEIHTLRS